MARREQRHSEYLSVSFPHFLMADTTESSSAMTMIVALVAILLLVGLGFFALRNINGTNTGGASINVDVPTGSAE